MKKIITLLLLLLSNTLMAQSIIFHEDMENPDSVVSFGNQGFVHDSDYYSQGSYSMHGSYGVDDSSYLTTISFSTLGSLAVVLTFDQIAKVSFFDACTIEFSNDSINWTQITTTNSVYLGSSPGFSSQGNKFTEAAYPDWAPGQSVPPDSTWWKTELFDITQLAANKTQNYIRFRMQDYNSGGLDGRFGWLIDNLIVYDRLFFAGGNFSGNYCLAPVVWNGYYYASQFGYQPTDSFLVYFNFGDGTDTSFYAISSTGVLGQLQHFYATSNTYVSYLIVTDKYGDSDTAFFNSVLSLCDTISGRLYHDNNSDCIYNSGDIAVEKWVTAVSGNSTYSVSSDSIGFYQFIIPVGQYILRNQFIYNGCFMNANCNSGVDSIIVNSMPSYNNDFVSDSVTPTQNLILYAKMNKISAEVIRIYYYGFNNDCNTISGFYQANFSPSVDSVSCNYYFPFGSTLSCNSPHIFNSNNYPTRKSYAKKIGGFANNDTICVEVRAEPVATDIDSTDNIITICKAFKDLKPYDPNMKIVFPDGEIPNNTELTYEIHFQNTGTAPAINVVVIDTLSQNVDLNTFKILGSTHTMNVAINNNREIQFMFPNINLPDSGADFNASMGSLMYSVKTIPGLVAGTQITNSCDIFFDQNAPVKTNTTVNTIILPNAIETISQIKNSISVYPNPASDFINVKSNNMPMKQISIFDITGQLIYDEKISSKHSLIDSKNFSNGIYILRIKTESGFYFEKVIQ